MTFRRFDPTGTYRLTVEPPGHREDLAVLGPILARDEDVTLTLSVARDIRGVVRGPDGAPVVEATIWRKTTEVERAATGDTRTWFGTTDEEGRFHLHRLSGTYSIVASKGTQPGGEPPWVEVDAGRDDVVLTLWGEATSD